jgi:hypothetical protein
MQPAQPLHFQLAPSQTEKCQGQRQWRQQARPERNSTPAHCNATITTTATSMLSKRAHSSDHLLLLAPRCHCSVQLRCRAATFCRASNIAPELVQLERSCLADLSTEELLELGKKHGGCVHTQTGPAALNSAKTFITTNKTVMPRNCRHQHPSQTQNEAAAGSVTAACRHTAA